MLYDLPGVQVSSSLEIKSFKNFSCRRQSDNKMLGLHRVAALPLTKKPIFTAHHKEIDIAVLDDGWQFSIPHAPQFAVRLNKNRDEILATITENELEQGIMLPLIRTAVECASADQGVISLHSAAVEINGQAVCFTAPSGVGKSTRAMKWIEVLGASFISGDRPSVKLDTDNAVVCGVPWDGKEKIYRNIQLPLKTICVIKRGKGAAVRPLEKNEARQVLMQQTFIPMWDTEAATYVMTVIRKLIDRVRIVELTCDIDDNSTKQAYDLIFNHPNEIAEES